MKQYAFYRLLGVQDAVLMFIYSLRAIKAKRKSEWGKMMHSDSLLCIVNRRRKSRLDVSRVGTIDHLRWNVWAIQEQVLNRPTIYATAMTLSNR